MWLLNDPGSNRHLGIKPFVYLPTGSYNVNHALTLVESRWNFSLRLNSCVRVTVFKRTFFA
ncbi:MULTISPECIES: transporter [Burkholderia]|uniref:transporter n=1 Tax=Burkholderia TaxID=32008 RepID=UPI00158A3A55|nr:MULTISPECIES: transporter [Burkholderia]